MQRLSMLLLCVMLTNLLLAINVTDSKVTEVTVYRSFAKETRVAYINIPEGNSEIIISNVSTFMDDNTLQVATKGNVKILSVSSKLNYLLDKKKSDAIVKLNDSIQIFNEDLDWIKMQLKSYNDELSVLEANKEVGSEQQGVKSEELKALLDLYRIKSNEIRKFIFDLEKKQKNIIASISKWNKQVTELNGNNNQAVKEIILKVHATSAGNVSFRCSYMVNSAYWMPVYDIRAKNVNEPLKLETKAKIVQNTGYDWKDVKLTLSTGNPSQNNNRPVLHPVYVNFYQPDFFKYKMEESTKNPQAGYYSNQLMNTMNTSNRVDFARAGETDDKEAYVDGLKADDNGVTIDEGNINVEYNLETAQDIESDNKEHFVGVQEIEIPASYMYHAVPKMEQSAFLLAKITDWGKYNLLAGEANIFFDEMYMGKSYLNPNVAGDTLLISLGRDEKISVKRVKLNEFTSTKVLSSKKKETRAFETIVKNNKNQPIEIEILDQYPISKDKDIEVELTESSGAKITADYGKMLWKIKLQPGESKKLRFIYTLRYPEDKTIVETLN